MLLALSLSGCGFVMRNTVGLFHEEPKARDPRVTRRGSRVEVTSLPRRGEGTASDIEVLWEIPADPVDAFIVSYTIQGDREPPTEVTVRAEELTRYEDRQYGFVYRYLLRGIPPEKGVNVSISAVKEGAVSPPSQVVTVAPTETYQRDRVWTQ